MKGSEPPRIKVKPQNTNTMKTKKHGHGMTHKQVVKFSNRLIYSGIQPNNEKNEWAYQYIEGWKDACKYFAHELRKELRYYEQLNEYEK